MRRQIVIVFARSGRCRKLGALPDPAQRERDERRDRTSAFREGIASSHDPRRDRKGDNGVARQAGELVIAFGA
jgi:hypothetical protein